MRPALRLSLVGLPLAAALSLAHAGSPQVGVSVSVNQPGFYGRVDIGDVPPPVIYPQPVIIDQRPVLMGRRPIYLRVPPGHERQWARYCGRYQACGQPVYFVRPDARDGRPHGWDDRRGDRHDDHGHEGRGRDDWGRDGGREDRHDHGRGHGHGHGH